MKSDLGLEATARDLNKTRESPWSRYEKAALGFRNYWYPAMPSRRVKGKPVGIRILGEKVMFVRHEGKCYALENRCAHRGVPLSAGRCNFPGTSTISCAYHGWTYDLTTGECVGALSDGPDSPIVGKVRVRTYPVEERKGLVWVYIGDGGPPRLAEDVPEELLEERAVMEVRVTERPGNWRLAAENGLDPCHAAYLHRDAWLAFLRRFPAAKSDVAPKITGQWVGYTQGPSLMVGSYPGLGSWPPAKEQHQWWKRPRKRPTETALRLPGYLKVDPFPCPGIIHYEWYVPIDERHHRYFQFSVRWTSGITAWRFRLAYWLWWRWLGPVLFNNQDTRMVQLMDPFYAEENGWKVERLFRPDVVLIAWRKHCHEKGREVQRLTYGQGQNGNDSRFAGLDANREEGEGPIPV